MQIFEKMSSERPPSTNPEDDYVEPLSATSTDQVMSLQLDELLKTHSETAGNWAEVVDDEIQQVNFTRFFIL